MWLKRSSAGKAFFVLALSSAPACADNLGVFAGTTVTARYDNGGSPFTVEFRFKKDLLFAASPAQNTGLVCAYGRKARVDFRECGKSNLSDCGKSFADIVDSEGWTYYGEEASCRVSVVGSKACIEQNSKIHMIIGDINTKGVYKYVTCITAEANGNCKSHQSFKATGDNPMRGELDAVSCKIE